MSFFHSVEVVKLTVGSVLTSTLILKFALGCMFFNKSLERSMLR